MAKDCKASRAKREEYKKKQKDEVAKINYSKATGFTGNKFILPNGSVCYFKFYYVKFSPE